VTLLTAAQIAKLPYRPNVGVCLTHADGRIWAGQRIDTSGAWQMPQGGVDPGEDPAAAALRELQEETGIRAADVAVLGCAKDWVRYDLPADLVPKLWHGRFRGQEQQWWHMRLNAPDSVINIAMPQPEFERWQWMAATDLLDAIVPFKRDAYARVLRDFRLL
jgi:putative (di)nucleoside polyphosphate hydrolase